MGFGLLAGTDFCVGEAVAYPQVFFVGVQKLAKDGIIAGNEFFTIFQIL